MLYVALLAVLALGGGGLYWYEKFGPGAQPAQPALPPPRQITLDTNLPDADKQTVIAAIMSQPSAAALTQMATQYASYPWTAYELNYRAWELNGSQGTPPAEPKSSGTVTPTPAPQQPSTPTQPAQPGQPPAPPGPSTPSDNNPPLNVKPPAPAAPSAGPFDLSAAVTAGAWQNNSAFIAAYQGALTFLAYKYGTPSWAPPAVNGTFDSATQAAVMAFQTAKGLSPVDGKVGKDTATAIATALVAPVTQTSGQGGYAAFPGEGDGPGDSRYGAHPTLGFRVATAQISGPIVQDQVSGAGEDEVQGVRRQATRGAGEDEVQGVRHAAMGAGEDEVQGVLRAQQTRGAEDMVQGTYRSAQRPTDIVEGLGEDEVQGVRRQQSGFGQRQIEISGAGAAAAVQAAQVALARTPSSRPRGGWYIRARDTDRIWPRKIAEIGSGVSRGTPGSLQHLIDINPHLAPGGVMRQITAGDEVNIPGGWANALRSKGLDVRSDPQEEMV